MEVRPALRADAGTIAAIHVASWRAAYQGLLSDDQLANLDVAILEEEWTRAIESPERPGVHLHVLRSGERIVGYTRFGPNRDDDLAAINAGEIYGFYIDPPAWGKGAGRHLMEAALTVLRSDGFVEATLWVVDRNQRARAFYEQLGWKHEPGPVNSCFGAPEVRYRLEL